MAEYPVVGYREHNGVTFLHVRDPAYRDVREIRVSKSLQKKMQILHANHPRKKMTDYILFPEMIKQGPSGSYVIWGVKIT